MRGSATSISATDLYVRLASEAAPLVLDVRREAAFRADDRMIVGAIRRRAEDIAGWLPNLPPGRTVIAYCGRGHEVSRYAAAVLHTAGIDAAFLEGGIEGWRAAGLPTRRRRGQDPGRWITRERPKIDRLACPWLIRRFIDPEAEIIYAPAANLAETATRVGATPFDIPGAAFGHVRDGGGERCSFDAFLRLYGIEDPPLDRLAAIVRAADTSRPELTPQSPGLLAISQGLAALFADDRAMLERGMTLYDALFAWCRTEATSQPAAT